MSNPYTFTTLISLRPSPDSTILALIDNHYLFIDCSLRPHFADWIITPAHELQRYHRQGLVLGVVVCELVSPHFYPYHWMQWLCRSMQDLLFRA